MSAPPVITLDPFTESQAEEVYRRYQAAADHSTVIPACRTPWSELLEETRSLLRSPLYLHLFMATFHGKPAEPLTNVPALFKRYVDTTLALRPGLTASIKAVVGHVLQDLGRGGAALGDDDCHGIRRKWAEAHSLEEARLHLSPVEALAHQGMIRKRVREEGGGYRFVFQTVAEYLIYRYLADERPPGEEALSYWVSRARHDQVFAEHAGAFGFLLRDWESRGTLSQAGRLLEASPLWIREVLTGFLMEQARVGYVPGSGSTSAELAAKALVAGGGAETAAGLSQTGYLLAASRFSIAARAYFQASWEVSETLYRENPENVAIAAGWERR